MDVTQVVKIAVFVVIAYIGYKYILKKRLFKTTAAPRKEGFTAGLPSEWVGSGSAGINSPSTLQPLRAPKIIDPASEQSKRYGGGYRVNTDLVAQSAALLPRPAAQEQSGWSEYAPKADMFTSKQFLDAKQTLIGSDTIGSSLKNANRQLRADPPIPRNDAAIVWNSSTISADPWRKELC
jgi:hypothetical protein